MIKRVLIILVIAIVVIALAVWLIEGGGAAVAQTARTLTNPLDVILYNGTSTGTLLRLPWQPATLTHGPDISQYVTQGDAQNQGSPQDQLAALEQQYDELNSQAAHLRTFGNPSPYAGEVRITNTAATESDPAAEYVEIEASSVVGAPVAITGWSLQSAVSGLRVYIPQGAPLFIMGVVNSVQPIYLDPGASAIITTGASPVGVSFRENACTGFLEQLQQFTPELSNACPAPSDALPETPENLRTYGSACFDYVSTLPHCYFPPSLPSNLSPACRSFVLENMAYNGCVNRYRAHAPFGLPSWRIYLGLQAEVWYNTHDIIRLLDAAGQTVDVLTY